MWALRPSKASFIFCIRLLSLILAACLCCTACLGLFPDAPFLLLFWLRLEIIIVLFFNRITISRLLLFECFQDRFLEITYKRWYDRKRREKNYFFYHFLNNNVFDAPVYEQPVYQCSADCLLTGAMTWLVLTSLKLHHWEIKWTYRYIHRMKKIFLSKVF